MILQPQIFWLFSLYMCKKNSHSKVFFHKLRPNIKHQKLVTGAITWQFLLSGTKTKKIKKEFRNKQALPKEFRCERDKKNPLARI